MVRSLSIRLPATGELKWMQDRVNIWMRLPHNIYTDGAYMRSTSDGWSGRLRCGLQVTLFCERLIGREDIQTMEILKQRIDAGCRTESRY
jgi:hypothetical protein